MADQDLIDQVSKHLEDPSYNEEVAIGIAIAGSSAFPRSKQELKEIGTKWIQQNRPKIIKALKSNPNIAKLIAADPSTIDEVNLIGMVLDVFLSASIGISPVVLTVVSIRFGVNKLLDGIEIERTE